MTQFDVRVISRGLKMAEDMKRSVIVTGPRASGKSTALGTHGYAAPPDGVCSISCYDGMGRKFFARQFCAALGEESDGTLDTMVLRIVSALRAKPKVIAIDDADFLTSQLCNLLVFISNAAKVGVVLVGSSFLDERIAGKDPTFTPVFTRLAASLTMQEVAA